MTLNCQMCESEDDFAQAGLFLLAHKRDLHPSFTTLEMVTLIYSYVTNGRLVSVRNEENRIVGIGAYYYGTPDREFQDKEVALVDVAIADKAYRGSRVFVQGLLYLVNRVIEGHPEVREIRLAAQEDNAYLRRLYSKFAKAGGVREGTHGREVVFHAEISNLRTILGKFSRL